MLKTYSEKATSPLNKREKKETRVAVGAPPHIEGRLNEGPWLQRKHKDENEQNKTNVTPEKDVMISAYQMPGGYKFAPHVAS